METSFLPLGNEVNVLDQWSQNNPGGLSFLLEELPISCLLCDKQLYIEYLNPAAEKTFGFSLEEARGKKLAELLIPRHLHPWLIPQFDRLLKTAETQSMEIESITKNGVRLPCKWKNIILHDNNNSPIGVVCLIQNLKEQKIAETSLKRQIERLNSLHTIDSAIIESADLQTILHVILQQTVVRLGLDAATVLIYDPVAKILKFAASQGLFTNALQYTVLHLGEGYAGIAALQKKTIQVPDLVHRKTDFLRSPSFNLEGFKSYICTPLIAKGEIKGVLEGFSRQTFIPDAEWLDFFEGLGRQTAIAIDNVNMFNSLRHSNIELERAYDAALEGWSRALDLRDHETENHTRRVTELADRLAQAMRISTEERVHIRRGAILHDIGKIGIPDNILLKEGALDEAEWEIMRRHPTFAYEMLSPIPYLKNALEIPYCHHEKWDGSGYPRGLKGDEIPLAARIFAVVDVYDALLSQRPYRNAWSHSETLDYIITQAGHHFDPRVVEIFLGTIHSLGYDRFNISA